MGDPALCVLQRRDGLFFIIELAALLAIDKHVAEALALLKRIPQLPVELRLMTPRFNDARIMTHRLTGAEPRHGGEGGVDVLDKAVGIGNGDRVGGLLQRLRQFISLLFRALVHQLRDDTRGAYLQNDLGGLTAGDRFTVSYRDHTQDQAGRVAQGYAQTTVPAAPPRQSVVRKLFRQPR